MFRVEQIPIHALEHQCELCDCVWIIAKMHACPLSRWTFCSAGAAQAIRCTGETIDAEQCGDLEICALLTVSVRVEQMFRAMEQEADVHDE